VHYLLLDLIFQKDFLLLIYDVFNNLKDHVNKDMENINMEEIMVQLYIGKIKQKKKDLIKFYG